MNITKSEFLKFRECDSHFWMLKHRPEIIEEKPISDFVQQIIDQGTEVELWARKRFPEGQLIDSWRADAIRDTQCALDSGVPILFQASFTADGIHARIDVLERTSEGFNIYEVKGTTASDKKDESHLWDAAFQKEVLIRSGHPVNQIFLIELNKEFRKNGEIDPDKLFVITNISEEIQKISNDVQRAISDAKHLLTQPEPITCDCMYKPSAKHCPTFGHFHPQVPAYTAHDLYRIGSSPKRLRSLIDDGLFGIAEIPINYDLTPNQLNQVRVHNLDQPIIKADLIEKSLAELEYPLYFLDYETYPAAIPVFEGCYPFQQVPFQYSVHIQYEPGGELQHCEFLHQDLSSPILAITQSLRENIGDAGSVIVWNKNFERKCNEDLAAVLPDDLDFLVGINNRFYDLADIFARQQYVDKGFKGKYSIKKVLPVLCPDLTYENLTIQDGGAACNAWKEMIFGEMTLPSIMETVTALLEYCKLDTLAMVKIYHSLNEIVVSNIKVTSS
ncbi:MAG: DUF2779 domain-containing protein [Saprospiraceae bacterium]|nr:DUF2779 domain-containing protein [Saprospiraceae bacterium]